MNKPLFALGVSLLLLAVGMLYGVSVAAQGFDACIAQYQAGGSGWCKISDDVFNNVRLTDAEANGFGVKGNVGSRAVMIAWNGGALDEESLIMYFHGGGHNDYYGNEWYAYDIRAGKFERLNDPSRLTHYYNTGGGNYCQIPDPSIAPNSAHTYDGIVFNPDTKTIFQINQGTSAFCSSNPPAGKTEVPVSAVQNIFEFNPSKTETRNGLAPLTYRNHGKHSLQYMRSTYHDGSLILGSNFDLYRYSFVDGVATQGPRIFNNQPAGQGSVESHRGEMVTYTSYGGVGYLWTFGGPSGATQHLNRVSMPGVSGGMACGNDECLFWGGGKNLYSWDRDNPRIVTPISHDTGPENGDGRVYSKWDYLPDYNVYVGVSNIAQPVWLYKLAGAVTTEPAPDPTPEPEPEPIPEPTPSVIDFATTGQPDYPLNITVTGSGAWSAGVGIPKGKSRVPNHPNAQTVCRVRWNDGSCKFAVVSGGAVDQIAPGQISVEFGETVVTPSNPIYRESGPYKTETWYRETAGDLLVFIYVQDFSGHQHVTVSVENGYLNKVTGQQDYTATITVGDQVETYTISQPRNTKWVADIYRGDFATARQDVAQLIESELVPDYSISPNATPGSYQAYSPMESGNHTPNMASGGYQDQIGLLPRWDAAYVANPSDAAFNSVIANAYALGSYRIVWRDAEGAIIEPSEFARWTVNGENQGGVTGLSANGLTWERAHFPSTGYLAYLLTGNPVHLDTLGHTASACYLVQTFAYGGGEGEQRLDLGQTRGQAWCWRAAGMYAAMTNGNGLTDRFANNMTHYAQIDNQLGITYRDGAYGDGVIGPWQQNFRVQTLGFLSDIEPLDDMSDLITLRNINYRFPVGLINSCNAGSYNLTIGNATSWDQVPKGNCALDNPTAVNYYANLLPAISYAVKHDAPGAVEAWGQLTAASNFNTWMNSFSSNPVWGVVYEPASIPGPEPEPEPTPVIEVDTVCSNPNWRVFVDGVQLDRTFQRETTMSDEMHNQLFRNPGAVVTSQLNVTCRATHRTIQ